MRTVATPSADAVNERGTPGSLQKPFDVANDRAPGYHHRQKSGDE